MKLKKIIEIYNFLHTDYCKPSATMVASNIYNFTDYLIDALPGNLVINICSKVHSLYGIFSKNNESKENKQAIIKTLLENKDKVLKIWEEITYFYKVQSLQSTLEGFNMQGSVEQMGSTHDPY